MYAHFKISNELFQKRVEIAKEINDDSSFLGKRSLIKEKIKLNKLDKLFENKNLKKSDVDKENFEEINGTLTPKIKKKNKSDLVLTSNSKTSGISLRSTGLGLGLSKSQLIAYPLAKSNQLSFTNFQLALFFFQ